MSTLSRLQTLLLHITPTTIRPALLLLNFAALALALHTGGHFSPLNERWD
jgi:hypothetical protein